jgi:SMC interacting uncharacterized protein involved in chromosome segregation
MNCFLKTSLALALAIPFVFACSDETKTNAASSDKLTTEKAMDAAKAKFTDMKNALAKATDDTMSWADKEMTEIKTKASSLSAEKKPEMDKLVAELNEKKADLKKMYDEAMASGESGFESMKTKVDNAAADLKKRIDAAMAKLK